MKETFAGKVREAVTALKRFSAGAVSDQLGIQTHADLEKVRDVISDMRRRGEVKWVARGEYEYLGRSRPPQKQAVMWRYLRSSRSFGGVTIDELREASNASADYAQEWIDLLASRGIVKSVKDRWQLVSDPIEMPQNDEKAARLRAVRAKKREKILNSLAKAKEAVADAEKLIREMTETEA
jgi:hypothetical protein